MEQYLVKPHKEIKVIFEPSGRSVYVLPGTIILEAAAEVGLIIESPCGGGHTCGKCIVRVTAGTCDPTTEEIELLGSARISDGLRLACTSRINHALTIEVSDAGLFQNQAKILTSDSREKLEVKPDVRKKCVKLAPPSHADSHSDLELLVRGLSDVTVSHATLSAMRQLPGALRTADFVVTAVTAGNELIAVEPGDTEAASYGVAFDLGSTTIVGTLVHMGTGSEHGIAARMNPQTAYGDDVITRIMKCRREKTGLSQLHGAVLTAVNDIVHELARKAKIDATSIYEISVAGNTTMQQIFCGIDPSALGEIPFLPAFSNALRGRAADFNLSINPEGRVYVFPQIGGFVGGDTVAGILATRIDRATEPALLVDIGTNGEIVLACNGMLLATSVAAGPAFEGARIVNGMRGARGAVEKILFGQDVQWNVIGNAKPSGICGTGLIDAAAEMLRTGILDSTGLILGPEEAPASVPDAIRARLVRHGDQVDFLLISAGESASGQPLFLYQKDIRELQLANGAIRAGINILLRMAGIEASALQHILLAGAFGNFIRRSNARRIGMLPPIPCHRILFVGNTASFGAKRALLSGAEKNYASAIVGKVRHVDLSLDPEFQLEFSTAMILPDSDLDECRE